MKKKLVDLPEKPLKLVPYRLSSQRVLRCVQPTTNFWAQKRHYFMLISRCKVIHPPFFLMPTSRLIVCTTYNVCVFNTIGAISSTYILMQNLPLKSFLLLATSIKKKSGYFFGFFFWIFFWICTTQNNRYFLGMFLSKKKSGFLLVITASVISISHS